MISDGLVFLSDFQKVITGSSSDAFAYLRAGLYLIRGGLAISFAEEKKDEDPRAWAFGWASGAEAMAKSGIYFSKPYEEEFPIIIDIERGLYVISMVLEIAMGFAQFVDFKEDYA